MRLHRLIASWSLVAAWQVLTPSVASGEIIVRMETDLGDIHVELDDLRAPVTVANFMHYVRDGDYENTFIHRSVTYPYIIQGGGYSYENGSYARVPADPAIVNEYGDDRPNSRGTIAMARLSNPNSATSEWFFNVGDNSATLGPTNTGGYAVFGRVLGSNDDNITSNDGASMALVDYIATLAVWDSSGVDPLYGHAWTDMPLLNYSVGQTFVPSQHQVMIHRITEVDYRLSATSHAGSTVTITTPSPATLANFTTGDVPTTSGMPAGIQFTQGFFAFDVNDIATGGAVSVALELPEGFHPNTYYMYGPTRDNPTDHWYEFVYDGQTGAEFFGNNHVVLHFIDGLRGDADLTANGQIVDPGAPGITTSSDSSGGGGCTMSNEPMGRADLPVDFVLIPIAIVALRQSARRIARERQQH